MPVRPESEQMIGLLSYARHMREYKLNAILNSRMQELIPYVLNLVLHIYLRY